jgi:hypothetical protein
LILSTMVFFTRLSAMINPVYACYSIAYTWKRQLNLAS